MLVCLHSIGAGGCLRLPYLIGLRQSLPIILTGSPIDPKKALRLGLMDDLWRDTHSIHSKEGKQKFHYQWIPELTSCINSGRIGNKTFPLLYQLSDANGRQQLQESIPILLPNLSEEEMLSKVKMSWMKCEEKASIKYPYRPAITPSILSPLYYVMDTLIYIISAAKLYKTVGQPIPSPYQALVCTWNCYHASSIQEGVVECTTRFARLIESAESKNLMSLFLLASVLKKQALGNEPPHPFNDVFVLMNGDGRGLIYVAQFIQSLLYGNFKVGVAMIHSRNERVWQHLLAAIKKQFEYSISRGYMTKENVRVKMEGLRLMDNIPNEDKDILIVNGCVGIVPPSKVCTSIYGHGCGLFI